MKKETIKFLDKCALIAYPLAYKEWEIWYLSDENIERCSDSFDDYRDLIAHTAYEMAEAMVMQRAEKIANLQELLDEEAEQITIEIKELK
tara:strand:+ start:905 stop:1174 length:270 start_codon:yes stop_codon:yes gene_type:complete